ncbi:MAG: peptide chain release factor 2 [Rickettsiales bacterium]
MNAELQNLISQIQESLNILRDCLDPNELKKQILKLEQECNDPQLWQNQENAKRILSNKEALNKKLQQFNQLEQKLNENIELYKLAQIDHDIAIINDLNLDLQELQKKINNLKIETLFANDTDHNDCFLEIHPGAGGTESHDWAAMLLRMYLRWLEQRNFSCEILSELKGDEAGIKAVTLLIKGENAHGWLKNEAGIHRLVRISPFNAGGKRMTSFASVWCYPKINEEINLEILDKDLRIDTYRASGAGGQHVNKTDSAIRITHLPTNIVVQCQNSRSQHQNREAAFKMLKSRLYELEMRKKEEATASLNANKTEIGWGNQIRSYVMQPYQMVKDLRTNYETANITGILNGEIDEMLTQILTFFAAKH